MTIYDNLPDDDNLAFLQLEAEFRNDLEAGTENTNSNFRHYASIYMNQTRAAGQILNIESMQSITIPNFEDSSFDMIYDTFRHVVDGTIIQIRILAARQGKRMSVGLSSEQKTKLHKLIEKIRAEIEASAASIGKREKLFEIIASLSVEINKDRTKLDRFGDLARVLAGISRDAAETGAEPWWKWFKLAMGIVDDAKEEELQLPKPTEIKKLEPPRKELPNPETNIRDDEIPF